MAGAESDKNQKDESGAAKEETQTIDPITLHTMDLEPGQEPADPDATKAAPPPPPLLAEAGGPDPLYGRIISGRYHVIKRLDEGGMGQVYEVHHLGLDKRMALKLLHHDLTHMKQFVSRFEREARSCSKLDHPNCVRVADFGQAESGALFLVMELVEGESLRDVIRKSPIDAKHAVNICEQLLRGLKHAHGAGIVHRDIKPGNIIEVTNDEGEKVVKILDFGIARQAIGEKKSGDHVTQAGTVMGTPEYMAPEQGLTPHVDGRADLYSVGVLLWRMLTGKRIFATKDNLNIVFKKLKSEAPPLEQVCPGKYSYQLNDFLQKALERHPKKRFQSAQEMLVALDKVQESSLLFEGRRPVWRTLTLRNRWFLPLLVAFCVVALVAGVVDQFVLTTPTVVELPNKTRWRLNQAKQFIAAKRCQDAADDLHRLIKEQPKLASAYYLLGATHFCRNHPKEGLLTYAKAIELDKTFRSNARILEESFGLLRDPKLRQTAIQFLGTHIGKPALARLVTLASADRDWVVRKEAQSYVTKLGGDDQVDWLMAFIKDLKQLPECEQRKKAVIRLGKLGDPRALAALKAARLEKGGFWGVKSKNPCIKDELDIAIGKLQKIEIQEKKTGRSSTGGLPANK